MADPLHVAGRVRRQRDRRLRGRGRHADPDLPDLRAAHDAGAEPEDGRGVHGGEHHALLRPTAAVRDDPGAVANVGHEDEVAFSIDDLVNSELRVSRY